VLVPQAWRAACRAWPVRSRCDPTSPPKQAQEERAVPRTSVRAVPLAHSERVVPRTSVQAESLAHRVRDTHRHQRRSRRRMRAAFRAFPQASREPAAHRGRLLPGASGTGIRGERRKARQRGLVGIRVVADTGIQEADHRRLPVVARIRGAVPGDTLVVVRMGNPEAARMGNPEGHRMRLPAVDSPEARGTGNSAALVVAVPVPAAARKCRHHRSGRSRRRLLAPRLAR